MALEMQRGEWSDAGEDLYLSGCPKGPGGNTTIINQHEDDILPMSWESIPCEETGFAESFTHVQDVYRMPEYGPGYAPPAYDRGASPMQMMPENRERMHEESGGY